MKHREGLKNRKSFLILVGIKEKRGDLILSIEEILSEFKDINHAYNNCTKYDTLERMLHELVYSMAHKLDIDEKILVSLQSIIEDYLEER